MSSVTSSRMERLPSEPVSHIAVDYPQNDRIPEIVSKIVGLAQSNCTLSIIDPGLPPTAPGPILACIHSAEIALSKALAEGKKPSVALNDWSDVTGNFIQRLRTNRRNTVLIDLEQAQRNPRRLVEVLQHRFGLSFLSELPGQTGSEMPDDQRRFVVMARLLLAADSEASMVARELDAMTSGGVFKPLIDANFLDEWLSVIVQPTISVTSLCRQRDLLLEDIEQLQLLLDKAAGELLSQRQSIDRQKADMAELQRERQLLASVVLQDGRRLAEAEAKNSKTISSVGSTFARKLRGKT